MFNLNWFDTWVYHIVGWPLLVLILCGAIWLRINWKVALVLLPLSFSALAWLTVDIEKIFGRSFPAYPEGEWRYLFHIEKGDSIELLVLDKDGTRLYNIPITEKNRQKLNQMGKKQKDTGVQQMGEFVRKKEGLSTDETELEFYDFPHQKFIKKNR